MYERVRVIHVSIHDTHRAKYVPLRHKGVVSLFGRSKGIRRLRGKDIKARLAM